MREQKTETREQTKKRVYSVTELTRNVRIILEDSFPAVWVEGEVSNFTLHTSGHMYLTLKDNASQLSCVIFRGANQKLKFKIKDGIKLICFGRISVYDKRGTYQLYIEEVEPKGLGALQLAFQQLKERLEKEGLFDKSHKAPVPFLPTRIGVITSPTGAAIRDILNVTRRRFSNVEIIINPVRVQGKGAETEIADAIKEFNKLNQDPELGRQIDVMIVGRGGGSLEDLWAFNEEIVARAIYDSKIPVISAVGHEIDYTISDLAADLRAPTPSAAAELVIPRKEELLEKIEVAVTRLKKELVNLFRQTRQRVDEFDKGLSTTLRILLDSKRQNFRVLTGKLEALSPLAVLSRGYSITTKLPAGEILKDSKNVKKGDKVETKLGRGTFTSEVQEVS